MIADVTVTTQRDPQVSLFLLCTLILLGYMYFDMFLKHL